MGWSGRVNKPLGHTVDTDVATHSAIKKLSKNDKKRTQRKHTKVQLEVQNVTKLLELPKDIYGRIFRRQHQNIGP